MYGPTPGELWAFVASVLIVGAILGVGCEHGCGYARNHIEISWKGKK